MHDTHQCSEVSEIIRKSFLPPRYNFILKNKIIISQINADSSSADTGERSAFLFFNPYLIPTQSVGTNNPSRRTVMATKTFNIDSFPTGHYMSWFVTTQAAFLVNARLFDDKHEYFKASKKSTNITPPLAQGAGDIKGKNLKLTIDEPESDKLDSSINAYNITASDGSVVGYGYNICIEDQADKDYNDVCISLVAWKSKG